jgi:hypothetical protein
MHRETGREELNLSHIFESCEKDKAEIFQNPKCWLLFRHIRLAIFNQGRQQPINFHHYVSITKTQM